MLLSSKSLALTLFAAIGLTALGGCGNGEVVDPHDIPLTEKDLDQLRRDTATWADAIEHVQAFRDTIRKETTGGEPAKAHRALDNLDHVLKWLPEIAQKSNVGKEQQAGIDESAKRLRDLFNKIHANIDDGKAPDYESVADDIDAAINKLAAIKAG